MFFLLNYFDLLTQNVFIDLNSLNAPLLIHVLFCTRIFDARLKWNDSSGIPKDTHKTNK